MDDRSDLRRSLRLFDRSDLRRSLRLDDRGDLRRGLRLRSEGDLRRSLRLRGRRERRFVRERRDGTTETRGDLRRLRFPSGGVFRFAERVIFVRQKRGRFQLADRFRQRGDRLGATRSFEKR